MTNDDPYFVIPPRTEPVPILLSSPHSGTELPPAIGGLLRPSVLESLEDTDWFIHQLYDFVSELGITIVHARYSRYVIDLNRDPANKPLYADARKETTLVPTHSFAGEPLYREEPPTAAEIVRRRERFYDPYHTKLTELLNEMRASHRHALLFDAHSIRRHIGTISPEAFPDLILGDQDGRTAHPSLSAVALKALQASEYQAAHNHPFKGGFITRHFGRPPSGIHALQLEMSQDIYMDSDKVVFRHEKAGKLREQVLRPLFESLVETMTELNA